MDIREKLNSGYYENKLPFCTVKRNVKKNKEYQKEDYRIYNLFKEDALKEVGLLNHPKADKIYNKAWNDGHAYGYGEVLTHLENLAELFID